MYDLMISLKVVLKSFKVIQTRKLTFFKFNKFFRLNNEISKNFLVSDTGIFNKINFKIKIFKQI